MKVFQLSGSLRVKLLISKFEFTERLIGDFSLFFFVRSALASKHNNDGKTKRLMAEVRLVLSHLPRLYARRGWGWWRCNG